MVTLERGPLRPTETGREFVLDDELLHPDGLPEEPPLRVHVGPIATGSVVREDPLIFERLARHVRKTIGVETEAAAIGQVAAHLERPSIIVKAASDHADHDKDDSFRSFACRASATWLFMFLHQRIKPLPGDDSLEGKAVVPSERDQRPSQTPHYADEQTQAVATELEFVYAAPECMHHPQAPDPRVDVYGLAMSAVFVLYEQELPFDVVRDAQAFINQLKCSDNMKDFLGQAASWTPEKRPVHARHFIIAATVAWIGYEASATALEEIVSELMQ